MPPEAIEPDTKDWTWTVERQCPECGFDASRVEAADLVATVRDFVAPWPERLWAGDVRERPVPTTWSPLEYASHVHEVLEVFRGRFELMAAEDNPSLPNWDQDAAAVEGPYAAADPDRIAREIPERAEDLVAALGAFDGRWERTAVRSDGATFTALTLGRYLVHDLAHHLHDVGIDPRR